MTDTYEGTAKVLTPAHYNLVRDSQGTYQQNGILKLAPLHTARLESFKDKKPQGMLIEGTVTNHCLSYGTGGAGGTVTVLGKLFNTANVIKLRQESAASDGEYIDYTYDKNKQIKSCSVYVRKITGNEIRFELRGWSTSTINVTGTLASGKWTLNAPSTVKVSYDELAGLEGYSGTWYRFKFIPTPAVVPTHSYHHLRIYAEGRSATDVEEIYVTGAQFEELPFVSSYIPTSGKAVTRQRDILKVPNQPIFNVYTMDMKGVLDYNENSHLEMVCYDILSPYTYKLVRLQQTGESSSIWQAKDTKHSLGDKATKGLIITSSSYDGTTNKGYLSGTKEVERSFDTESKSIDIEIRGTITKRNALGGYVAHLHQFRIWEVALTDAQVANPDTAPEPIVMGEFLTEVKVSTSTSETWNATGTAAGKGFTFNGKTAIGGTNDSWLRLNPHSQFTSGTYTSGLIRADQGFLSYGKPFYSAKSSNSDYLWHDDGANTWHFVSDGPQATGNTGNSKLVAGIIQVNSSSTAVHSTSANSNGDRSFNANYFNFDISGIQPLTANRSMFGINLDIDSSAKGGTTYDLDVIGYLASVHSTGSQDRLEGFSASVEAEPPTGSQSYYTRGAYITSTFDGKGGTGGEVIGAYLVGQNASSATSKVNYIKGSFSRAITNSTHFPIDIVGARNEVELNAGTVPLAIATHCAIDVNGGKAVNAALVYGRYEGATTSNITGRRDGLEIRGSLTNRLDGSIDMGVSGTTDSRLTLSAEDNKTLRVSNEFGWINIGPYNTSFAHFATDRGKFYFNKPVYVDGEIYTGPSYDQRVYHTGYKPTAADVGAVKKTGDTMTGDLITTQVWATDNYALLKNGNVGHGVYLGTDKRTIIGGGDTASGRVVLRPKGIGQTTGEVEITNDGSIKMGNCLIKRSGEDLLFYV